MKNEHNHLTITILLAVAAIAAQFDIWFDIFSIGWNDLESSHVLLVPLVVGWLFWMQRARLADWKIRAAWFGPVLIVAGFVAQRVGYTGSILALWHFAAILTLVGAIVCGLGINVFRKFAPAAVALCFIVPLPGLLRQQISLPLQRYSAMITENVLGMFNDGVERAGNILYIGGEVVTVAEACNGLRMLAAIALVVYTMCFSTPLRTWQRAALLIATPVIAMLLNTIRLIATVLLYGYASEGFATGFHDISGWVIPLLMMFGLMAIVPVSSDEQAEKKSPQQPVSNLSSIVAALAVIVFVAVANLQYRLDPGAVAAHHERMKQLVDLVPYSIGDWIGTDGELHKEEIDLLKPNAALRRHYKNTKTGQSVTLLVLQSRNARTMIGHEPGVCYVGQGWSTLEKTPTQWPSGVNGVRYKFEKNTMTRTHQMHVFNILVTPRGETTGSMHVLAKAAVDYRLKQLGAMEIQLISHEPISPSDWFATSQSFLAAVDPLVEQYRKLKTLIEPTSEQLVNR